jgi:hypothetical protein
MSDLRTISVIRPEDHLVRITIDAAFTPAEVDRVVNDIRAAAREAYVWSVAKARAEAEAKSKADAEAAIATMPGGWLVRYHQGGYTTDPVRYVAVTLHPDGTPSVGGLAFPVIRSAPPDVWWRVEYDRTLHVWRNGERVCNRDHISNLTRIYGYREGDPPPKWRRCKVCEKYRSTERSEESSTP